MSKNVTLYEFVELNRKSQETAIFNLRNEIKEAISEHINLNWSSMLDEYQNLKHFDKVKWYVINENDIPCLRFTLFPDFDSLNDDTYSELVKLNTKIQQSNNYHFKKEFQEALSLYNRETMSVFIKKFLECRVNDVIDWSIKMRNYRYDYIIECLKNENIDKFCGFNGKKFISEYMFTEAGEPIVWKTYSFDLI